MMIKVLVFPLNRRFISVADETTITLLVLYFLFLISELSEFINDDSRDDIGQQDIEKRPVNHIGEESAIVTAISLSTGTLTDDSLRIKRFDTGDNSCAVRSYMFDVYIYRFVLVQNLNIVIDRKKAKDEGKGSGQ